MGKKKEGKKKEQAVEETLGSLRVDPEDLKLNVDLQWAKPEPSPGPVCHPPFNPYQRPENKQVGVLVEYWKGGGAVAISDISRYAFPFGARWKWEKIMDVYFLTVFHEDRGEQVVDAQVPADRVISVTGPNTLIRDKEW